MDKARDSGPETGGRALVAISELSAAPRPFAPMPRDARFLTQLLACHAAERQYRQRRCVDPGYASAAYNRSNAPRLGATGKPERII
jgi:hypothetical protein